MATVVIIDKLTRSIEDAASDNTFETDVVPLEKAELAYVLKKSGWRFSWHKEMERSDRIKCKLVIKGNHLIQGLISFQVMDNFIEMHLIEYAPHNIGHQKRYLGVPGNLVAFVCKMSFDLGFKGYIAFTSKTELIQHYQKVLGAELIYRNRMMIATMAAKKLVNSYYENYLNT
jgi:hypothetical protein